MVYFAPVNGCCYQNRRNIQRYEKIIDIGKLHYISLEKSIFSKWTTSNMRNIGIIKQRIQAKAKVFTENFNVLNLLYKIFHLCWLPLVFPDIYFALFSSFCVVRFLCHFLICFLSRITLVVLVYALTSLLFVALQRIAWHMAFIPFSASLWLRSECGWKMWKTPMEKSSEPITATTTATAAVSAAATEALAQSRNKNTSALVFCKA